MHKSFDLPQPFKENISFSMGWIKNSGIAHNWYHTGFFLFGIKWNSIGLELYLGPWYFCVMYS
jgi:hypothetical protein